MILQTIFKNKREKFIGVSAVIFLVGVMFYVLVVEDGMARYRAKANELDAVKVGYAKMRSDMMLKDRIAEKFGEIESSVVSSGNSQQEISVFSNELNDIYSKFGVSVRSIKILPVVNEKFYRKIKIRFEVEGQAKEVLRLIEAMESKEQAYRFEKVNIKAKQTRDNVNCGFVVSKIVSL